MFPYFATLGLLPATIIAYLLYNYDIFTPGLVMLLFFANLLIMGWWMVPGIVSLLFRYGAGAEALPVWLQPFAQALPASYIFEGVRAALAGRPMPWDQLGFATAPNIVWMLASIAVFAGEFRRARIRGALISIGE